MTKKRKRGNGVIEGKGKEKAIEEEEEEEQEQEELEKRREQEDDYLNVSRIEDSEDFLTFQKETTATTSKKRKKKKRRRIIQEDNWVGLNQATKMKVLHSIQNLVPLVFTTFIFFFFQTITDQISNTIRKFLKTIQNKQRRKIVQKHSQHLLKS